MSHWQSRAKIRTADKYFSEFVRRRDGRCVYATPRCKNWSDWKDLTCSHFIKRRYESVRYDPDNADSACRSCHGWVEDTAEGAQWLETFKREQLGETKFTGLLLRKQTTCKRDDKLMALVTKQMLTDLLDASE
jgi:5-methylcytosine-specific restriction endonuclease McrA